MALLIFLLSYIFGVIPTGKIVALCHGVDIEKVGSGNVGATNVARALGKKAGIITLLLDIIKGATPILLCRFVFDEADFQTFAAVGVVFGHCLSIPGVLKGGKGIATSLGVLSALMPLCAIISLSGFILVFITTRIVSLGSLAATLIVFIYCLIALPAPSRYILALIPLIVAYRHIENIRRLINGQEGQFKAQQ